MSQPEHYDDMKGIEKTMVATPYGVLAEKGFETSPIAQNNTTLIDTLKNSFKSIINSCELKSYT